MWTCFSSSLDSDLIVALLAFLLITLYGPENFGDSLLSLVCMRAYTMSPICEYPEIHVIIIVIVIVDWRTFTLQ